MSLGDPETMRPRPHPIGDRGVAGPAGCGVNSGVASTAKTVQVVLDVKLLRAADREARRSKCNRSALVRDALREHLRRLQVKAWEEQERAAYTRLPEDSKEARFWENEAVWPEG